MPGFELAPSWLNSSRPDWVNNVDEGDHGIDPKTGCALLFIYYLFTSSVTASGDHRGGGDDTRRRLPEPHGRSGDPFPIFKQLLDAAYPFDYVLVDSGTQPRQSISALVGAGEPADANRRSIEVSAAAPTNSTSLRPTARA